MTGQIKLVQPADHDQKIVHNCVYFVEQNGLMVQTLSSHTAARLSACFRIHLMPQTPLNLRQVKQTQTAKHANIGLLKCTLFAVTFTQEQTLFNRVSSQ